MSSEDLSKHSDKSLVEIFAKGRDVFAEIYKRFSPGVLRYCNGFLQDWQLAEEACNDSFMVIKQKPKLFDGIESPIGFLNGIAKNRCREIRSKRGKIGNMEKSFSSIGEDGENMLENMSGTKKEPRSTAALPKDVIEAINKLTARQQTAITAYYIGGMSYKEIAARNATTPGSVSDARSCGMKRLQNEFHVTFPPQLILKAKKRAVKAVKEGRAAALKKKPKDVVVKQAKKIVEVVLPLPQSQPLPISISHNFVEIAERFSRMYPRLSELKEKLVVMEALMQ